MITLNNNVTLRNLEEQVQKNKEDIARHYEVDRALSNLGIKVVGQVSTESQLPDPLTYAGEYGDTYAVGYKALVDQGKASYDYYVFTRPDANSGTPDNHWLNVGKISIAGPQGVQGIQGPQGPAGESSKWYTGANPPDEANENDMYLNNNGDVYQYQDSNWVLIESIKGPQGIQGVRGLQGERGEQGQQGEQGPRGDVGGLVNIMGILSSTSQLPNPIVVNNLTTAYLIGTNEPYSLYIQVGETPDVAIWTDTGPLNAATLVTSGGVYQNIWDADTKLTKLTPAQITDNYYRIYGAAYTGTKDTHIFKASQKTHIGGNIAMYDFSSLGGYTASGEVRNSLTGAVCTAIPEGPSHATPKKYVDDKLDLKLTAPTNASVSSSAPSYIIGQSSTSGVTTYRYKVASSTGNNSKNAVAKYNSNGNLVSGVPTVDNEVVNKQHLDSKLGKIWKHTFNVVNTKTGSVTCQGSFYATSNSVNLLSEGGNYFRVDPDNAQYILSPILYTETIDGVATGYAMESANEANAVLKSKTFTYSILTLPNLNPELVI